jgi:hypothetical protein
MPRYRVDPRQVKAVEMKDGTRYRVPPSGVVSIGHQHEAEMNRSPVLEGNVKGDAMTMSLAMPGGHGPTCPTCGFVGWAWQRVCPKDAASLS